MKDNLYIVKWEIHEIQQYYSTIEMMSRFSERNSIVMVGECNVRGTCPQYIVSS